MGSLNLEIGFLKYKNPQLLGCGFFLASSNNLLK